MTLNPPALDSARTFSRGIPEVAKTRGIPATLKAPVDLLELVGKLEEACIKEGKLRASDRHHMEYGDDAAQGLRQQVTEEVERLQGCEYDRDILLAALQRAMDWLASHPGGGTLGKDGPYEQARAALKEVGA